MRGVFSVFKMTTPPAYYLLFGDFWESDGHHFGQGVIDRHTTHVYLVTDAGTGNTSNKGVMLSMSTFLV